MRHSIGIQGFISRPFSIDRDSSAQGFTPISSLLAKNVVFLKVEVSMPTKRHLRVTSQ